MCTLISYWTSYYHYIGLLINAAVSYLRRYDVVWCNRVILRDLGVSVDWSSQISTIYN